MFKRAFYIRNLLAACILAFAGVANAAESPPITAATLVDRAMIEDLLIDYYSHLGAGNTDFGKWYAKDGILDVNGQVGRGEKGIAQIYTNTAARNARNPARKGTFRMVLSNVRIVVTGDTATADSLYTGLNSETVTSPPLVVEQGREHDELVKEGGRWLFRHRVITGDGGLNPEVLSTYKKR
jgi:SnoaL-like domain